MPPYAYSKLDSKNHEIRLVTLLPGEFIDPIRITIAHQPFIVESEKRRPIPTLPTEDTARVFLLDGMSLRHWKGGGYTIT